MTEWPSRLPRGHGGEFQNGSSSRKQAGGGHSVFSFCRIKTRTQKYHNSWLLRIKIKKKTLQNCWICKIALVEPVVQSPGISSKTGRTISWLASAAGGMAVKVHVFVDSWTITWAGSWFATWGGAGKAETRWRDPGRPAILYMFFSPTAECHVVSANPTLWEGCRLSSGSSGLGGYFLPPPSNHWKASLHVAVSQRKETQGAVADSCWEHITTRK